MSEVCLHNHGKRKNEKSKKKKASSISSDSEAEARRARKKKKDSESNDMSEEERGRMKKGYEPTRLVAKKTKKRRGTPSLSPSPARRAASPMRSRSPPMGRGRESPSPPPPPKRKDRKKSFKESIEEGKLSEDELERKRVKRTEEETREQVKEPADLNEYVNYNAIKKKYVCKVCDKFCNSSRYNVRNHVEAVHFSNYFKYPCGLCDKIVGSKNVLNIHMSRVHKAKK